MTPYFPLHGIHFGDKSDEVKSTWSYLVPIINLTSGSTGKLIIAAYVPPHDSLILFVTLSYQLS